MSYDDWKLESPSHYEEGDPEPMLDLGGDILAREYDGRQWLYLVAGEDDQAPEWLVETDPFFSPRSASPDASTIPVNPGEGGATLARFAALGDEGRGDPSETENDNG